MKWEKLGLIFDPSQHDLGTDIVGFAQGPQALVFDEFVRVYFSARRQSANGKYLSCIRFADFDKGFRRVIDVCDKPVIADGKLGSFDEHGIFPMNFLRVGDRILGYTCGWSRRVSVSIDMAIGLATSADQGRTFQRDGDGPVLSASPHEPFLVGDPCVRMHGSVFHMWYIFGTRWQARDREEAPERTYKIGHAVSADGREWTKEEARQIIPDRLGPDESQALPTVIDIGGRHHMFFCYRESFDFRRNGARGYRIGHAWSDDLRNWTRDDQPALEGTPGDWDADMQCYPHAFECDGEVYLLYNGNEFGRHGFGLARLDMDRIDR